MSVGLVHRPGVRTDIDEAFTHYEQKAEGLGERFLQHLEERLEAIRDNPEAYAILKKEVRAAPLRRFPYVVYYRLQGQAAVILAVMHGHRDAKAWMSRT